MTEDEKKARIAYLERVRDASADMGRTGGYKERVKAIDAELEALKGGD